MIQTERNIWFCNICYEKLIEPRSWSGDKFVTVNGARAESEMGKESGTDASGKVEGGMKWMGR